MADVEVTYNNNKIVELSESGTKTLKTAGKYCEDDIELKYVKPEGSGSAETLDPSSAETLDPSEAINFYDYDGTLIDQWPLTELQSKTALPECPTHEGLTSQGWNWSLADLKTANHAMNVGALYIPTDGKTHIFVRISDGDTTPCDLCFNQSTANSATVDWGDGSDPVTGSWTGAGTSKCVSHTYETGGDYEITIDVAEGKTISLNTGSNDWFINNLIYKVHIGERITFSSYMFVDSTRLEIVTIPRGVTSISTYAFNKNRILKACILPDGLTSIGNYAFDDCNSLKVISFPNSLQTVGNYGVAHLYTVKNIYFGDNLTSLGGYAVYTCSALEDIYLPDSLTSLGTYCFAYSRSLRNITIPGVTSISSYAFSECTGTTTIKMKSGVVSIGEYAFQKCFNLESITIPDTVTSISQLAFTYCVQLKEITIPPNVTTMNSDILYQCFALKTVNISGNPTNIRGFQECFSLENYTIPDSVTTISAYVFKDCTSLKEITIGPNVTSIGKQSFYHCYALMNIYFKGTTPPSVSASDAFTSLSKHCVIHVPTGYLTDYTSKSNYPSSSTYTYVEEDYTEEETE